jgi:hypothetical protein
MQDTTCSDVGCFVPELRIVSDKAAIDNNHGSRIALFRPAMGTCFMDHLTLVVFSGQLTHAAAAATN